MSCFVILLLITYGFMNMGAHFDNETRLKRIEKNQQRFEKNQHRIMRKLGLDPYDENDAEPTVVSPQGETLIR